MSTDMKARFSEPDVSIYYPVTVDEKKLWALMRTGDAIIRNSKPERIEHWEKLREIIAQQCRQLFRVRK